jgi:hypothetical protein
LEREASLPGFGVRTGCSLRERENIVFFPVRGRRVGFLVGARSSWEERQGGDGKVINVFVRAFSFGRNEKKKNNDKIGKERGNGGLV